MSQIGDAAPPERELVDFDRLTARERYDLGASNAIVHWMLTDGCTLLLHYGLSAIKLGPKTATAEKDLRRQRKARVELYEEARKARRTRV